LKPGKSGGISARIRTFRKIRAEFFLPDFALETQAGRDAAARPAANSLAHPVESAARAC
jgi:hypothetical protein